MRLKISLVAAVAVFGLLGSGQAAMGQAAPVRGARAVAARAVPAAQAAKSEEEAAVPNTPSQQGIRVHGHWVINVRDAQGKIVEHRDFENALQPTGATALVEFLIGSLTPAYLHIVAQHTDSSGHTDGAYFLFPAAAASEYQTFCSGHPGICSFNLAMTPVVSTTTPTGNIAPSSYLSGVTLEGTLKATEAISLDKVYTSLNGCQSTVPQSVLTTQSPSACQAALQAGTGLPANVGNEFISPFTGTDITPLVVSAGQTLDITVTLSFS